MKYPPWARTNYIDVAQAQRKRSGPIVLKPVLLTKPHKQITDKKKKKFLKSVQPTADQNRVFVSCLMCFNLTFFFYPDNLQRCRRICRQSCQSIIFLKEITHPNLTSQEHEHVDMNGKPHLKKKKKKLACQCIFDVNLNFSISDLCS